MICVVDSGEKMWYLVKDEFMASVLLLMLFVVLGLKMKSMDDNIKSLEDRLEILENESMNNMRINYEKNEGKYKI